MTWVASKLNKVDNCTKSPHNTSNELLDRYDEECYPKCDDLEIDIMASMLSLFGYRWQLKVSDSNTLTKQIINSQSKF